MEENTRKRLYWAIPLVVVIGLGVALYYGRKQQAEITPAAQEQRPPQSVVPPVQHPLGEADASKPLPGLAESDETVQESLGGLFGRSLEPFLVPQNIVRHVVVTIDNLPRKKTAVQLWPVKPTSGELIASPEAEPVLSEENFARYTPVIKVVAGADMAQLATTYRTLYPLFQQAYVDLGYPQGYFNDRLVEVIDHLLDTPEIAGPIKLTQPGVFYQYADSSLEERSAGQKLLIRMGEENAAVVKAKLRQLRAQIAGQQKP